MPYTQIWCDAELVLAHKDVRVYRSYKGDRLDEPRTYWFVLEAEATEDEAFDVRDLDPAAGDETRIIEVLKKAIDDGRLTKDGIHDPD